MPRSKDRMSLELPTYLYERLAVEADKRRMTTARLAAELIGRALLGETSMSKEETISLVLAGELEPDTSKSTTGRTVYYENTSTPLVDTGRVPGHAGLHVLRKPDGSLMVAGGYHLATERGHWVDALAACRVREHRGDERMTDFSYQERVASLQVALAEGQIMGERAYQNSINHRALAASARTLLDNKEEFVAWLRTKSVVSDLRDYFNDHGITGTWVGRHHYQLWQQPRQVMPAWLLQTAETIYRYGRITAREAINRVETYNPATGYDAHTGHLITLCD